MAYTTLAEVRALSGLEDEDPYSDANITEGIAWATDVIDEWCGVPFEPKAFTVTLDGTGRRTIWTEKPLLVSLTAVSIDGVALSSSDWAAWALYEDGMIRRDEGVFAASTTGRNVVISGTHGHASVPESVAYAARTLARWYVLKLESETPSNAITATNEWGTVVLAQPGKHGPTPLPQVNEVLKRYRVRGFGA